MARMTFLAVAIGTILVVATRAQEPASSTSPGDAQPPLEPFVTLSGFSNDYRVGPGDLLEVQVIGHDDLHDSVRVSNSGEISLRMLGLVQVADLTAFEVESTLADRLQERQLIQDPQVLVFVREYQAKPIYVSGAVVNPGEFIMSQELTVADAVLLAGGLQVNASNEGLLYRRRTAEAQSWSVAALTETPETEKAGIEVIKMDLRPLKEGRFLEAALPLQRGDVLLVPIQPMNAFYVVGEVVEPRNFFYPVGRTLTASQAISWAQGPLPTAKMSKGMLVRYDEQGNRIELKVDYDAILKGKQTDFPIQSNDIIFIPGSRAKSFAHEMLLLTDRMTMNASFRAARILNLPDTPWSETNPNRRPVRDSQEPQ